MVRPMREGELPVVQALFWSLHPAPYEHEEWPKLVIFVAEEDGRIVGYSSALVGPDNNWYLIETLVLPEYQGRGIGRALMEKRLEFGTALGCIEAICTTGDDTPHAMRHLLREQGFLETNIEVNGRRIHRRILGGWA